MVSYLLIYLWFSIAWSLFVGIYVYAKSEDLWYATKSMIGNLFILLPAIIFIIWYLVKNGEFPPVKKDARG